MTLLILMQWILRRISERVEVDWFDAQCLRPTSMRVWAPGVRQFEAGALGAAKPFIPVDRS
jgi:hypothetical protein